MYGSSGHHHKVYARRSPATRRTWLLWTLFVNFAAPPHPINRNNMKTGIIVATVRAKLDLLLPTLKRTLTDSSPLSQGSTPAPQYGRRDAIAWPSKQSAASASMPPWFTGASSTAFGSELVINTGTGGREWHRLRQAVMDVVVGDRRWPTSVVWCGPAPKRGQIQGMPRFLKAPPLCARVRSSRQHKPPAPRTDCQRRPVCRQCRRPGPKITRAIPPTVKAVDMGECRHGHTCHSKVGVPFASIRAW